MTTCELCNKYFPPSYYDENGKWHKVSAKRKYCFDCSPLYGHNTKNLVHPQKKSALPNTLNCITCHKPLVGTQTKFCSKKCKGRQYAKMGWNYNSERTRRRRMKEKAVEYLGGHCSNCHQKFPNSAFDFHHFDPTKKDSEMSRKMLRYSWNTIKKELSKCILLCKNCHAELHNNNGKKDNFGNRHVLKWKKREIEYLGGKCEICGYNKSTTGLCFHHKDATKKEYNISAMWRYGWEKVKKELDKCMLLCLNCHQIHYPKEKNFQ